MLWVLTGTHPCGPSPSQDGGGYQSASSCCGDCGVICRGHVGRGNCEDGVRIPTPLNGEWAASANHWIRSPSPQRRLFCLLRETCWAVSQTMVVHWPSRLVLHTTTHLYLELAASQTRASLRQPLHHFWTLVTTGSVRCPNWQSSFLLLQRAPHGRPCDRLPSAGRRRHQLTSRPSTASRSSATCGRYSTCASALTTRCLNSRCPLLGLWIRLLPASACTRPAPSGQPPWRPAHRGVPGPSPESTFADRRSGR